MHGPAALAPRGEARQVEPAAPGGAQGLAPLGCSGLCERLVSSEIRRNPGASPRLSLTGAALPFPPALEKARCPHRPNQPHLGKLPWGYYPFAVAPQTTSLPAQTLCLAHSLGSRRQDICEWLVGPSCMPPGSCTWPACPWTACPHLLLSP